MTEVSFDANASTNSGNAMIPQSLLDGSSRSGEKYTSEDLIMISKNSSGKLSWLEKGDAAAGLRDVLDRHANDLLAKGVTDIPAFIQRMLTYDPVSSGIRDGGPYDDHLIDGVKFKLTYGDNGSIVSLLPVKQCMLRR